MPSGSTTPWSQSRPARLRRVWWRWRHTIAALCVALAVGAGLSAHAPPTFEEVVVVRGDLPAGAVITVGDVELADVADGARADDALTEVTEAVGQALVTDVAAGTTLAPSLLLGPHLAGELDPGDVVIAVPVVAYSVAGLVEAGAQVSLLAPSADGGAAEVVATGVRVVSVSESDTGWLSVGGSETDLTVLHVVCSQEVANVLIGSSSWTPLSVALPAR